MKFIKMLVVILATLSCGATRAESVGCSGTVDHVVVESGQRYSGNSRILYPNAIEEDISVGSEEKPTHIEWNELNVDAQTTPSQATCYKTEHEIAEHITIPPSINRCILDHGKFLCQSGTVSCPGDVGKVRLVQEGEDKHSKFIEPEAIGHGDLIWHVDQQTRIISGNASLVAHCVHLVNLGASERMVIPKDMKLCKLSNTRFICTSTPDEYDSFWPKSFISDSP